MKIAVLGTGVVGQTLAGKLNELGHDVAVGTRDPAVSLEQREPLMTGAPGFGTWHEQHPAVGVATFSDAAREAELVVLAVSGLVAQDVLTLVGADAVDGKIVIDVTNPLDFSGGMPPTLGVCNTDSIGEQLQRAFPDARIVKTLNTVTSYLMVDPSQLAGGDHTIFVSGDDPAARTAVSGYLTEWFGWQHVLELGDISTARGPEMYLALWLRLWTGLETPMLNVKLVSQPLPA